MSERGRTASTRSAAALHAAERELAARDSVLAGLIHTHGPCRLHTRRASPFATLARSIINQQLSAQAAAQIETRVRAAVPAFDPGGFLAADAPTLRAAGLSGRKIDYLQALAAAIDAGRLDFTALRRAPDEAVIEALVALPGIGRWTAEMFLLFGLHRPDVLALGDAGLQRAARMLYGEDADLAALGEHWRPYRSVASWYLWRHLGP